MPLALAHLPSAIHSNIDDVKSVAVKMGGKRNASCRFLKSGCQDAICKSTNSVVRKGVLQIPRNKDLPESLLQNLDCRKHNSSSTVTSLSIICFSVLPT